MKFTFIGAATLLLTGQALATHPFSTQDSATQSPGAVELELSATGAGSVDDDSWVELGSALHVGLSASLEGGFAVVYGFSPDQGDSSMYDPWVDLKWRLSEGRAWVPSVALSGQYKPPQRTDGASSGHGTSVDVVSSVFRDRLSIHCNAGAHGEGIGTGGGAWLLRTAVAFVWQASRGVGAGIDIAFDAPAGGPVSASSTAALLWEPVSRRLFSVGIGPGWEEGASPGWRATIAWTAGFGG